MAGLGHMAPRQLSCALLHMRPRWCRSRDILGSQEKLMASEEKVAELQEQLQRMRIEQVADRAEAECMA